jgi:ferredoxin--NADP+ reductase
MTSANNICVAVIGAGPAGLFAAKELAEQGIHVFLLNRDVKPGGLAEYGIYPDKHKLKDGLRKQFNSIIEMPEVEYFGNFEIGEHGDMRLNELRDLGFDAVLVAVGAQGTKWLGLEGESLEGVYHAKDIVYYYNQLPPFSMHDYAIGKNVAIIGVGNVMMDIARYLICEKQVETVTAIARRGPAEIKFTKKELEYVIQNLDFDDFHQEMDRFTPLMQSIGQDPQKIIGFFDSAMMKSEETNSDTKFKIRFLLSIKSIQGDEDGRVNGVVVEENTLVVVNGDTKARGTGKLSVLPCDTVIFAIGDKVDPSFGLPVNYTEYFKNMKPKYACDGVSYESFDPTLNENVEGVFLAGWAREASSGLVGTARRDGVTAVKCIMNYLEGKQNNPPKDIDKIREKFLENKDTIVTELDLKTLQLEEMRIAAERGLPSYKFSTNAEMISVIKHKIAS